MIVINNIIYTSFNDFDVINEEQFLVLTNYGVTFFDITMVYDGNTFENTTEIVEYIQSIFN